MSPAIAARLDGLRVRYSEPHRHYHNQAHVDALLAGLRLLGTDVRWPEAVELAIWYHDAVYDPAAAAPANEFLSAQLLEQEMRGLADLGLVGAASMMVRHTADHALTEGIPESLRGDCAIFLDLDMAVLGASPAEYDAYEAGIAAEYIPVHGAASFRKGRARFLSDSLRRPRLFLTDHFHKALDRPARRNIGRALEALTE